jgi:hypothetical protein
MQSEQELRELATGTDYERVKELMAMGVLPNVGKGDDALRVAATAGNLKMIELMLEHLRQKVSAGIYDMELRHAVACLPLDKVQSMRLVVVEGESLK